MLEIQLVWRKQPDLPFFQMRLTILLVTSSSKNKDAVHELCWNMLPRHFACHLLGINACDITFNRATNHQRYAKKHNAFTFSISFLSNALPIHLFLLTHPSAVCLLLLLIFISPVVDQPVHQCLDTLHREYARYTDRPYGGILPKDIDRISSLFY